MADNRKYYYLKLKEDFFDTDEMKILESMKDGYLYSNILLKLYLKSLSNSGRLMYRNVIPYTPEILATLTGHQVGTVEKALDVFKKLDLIEMLDNGAIYMMDIQNFIGQSSSEADRQREYYNRMKAEKEALAGESTETRNFRSRKNRYYLQNRSQIRRLVITPRISRNCGMRTQGRLIKDRHTRSIRHAWKMVSHMSSCMKQ